MCWDVALVWGNGQQKDDRRDVVPSRKAEGTEEEDDLHLVPAPDPQERNGSLVVPHFGILLYSSSFQLSLKKMTKSALSSNSKIVSKSRIRVAPVAASLSTSAPQLQVFYPRQDRKTPPLILLILKPSVHINSSIILTPYHNVLSHMARRFTTCVNERGKGQDTKGQTTHCP